MADPKDAGLPEKRRPDEIEEKKREDSNKKQKKVEIPSEDNGIHGFTMAELQTSELEDDEDDEEDYDAEEDESDEDGDEEADKGKEIVLNEKGKGKLLVDSDSSDDSDSDFSDGLDLEEDDLLAEIDLDNILPSKTRNRGPQPGLRISSNCDDKDTECGAGSFDVWKSADDPFFTCNSFLYVGN